MLFCRLVKWVVVLWRYAAFPELAAKRALALARLSEIPGNALGLCELNTALKFCRKRYISKPPPSIEAVNKTNMILVGFVVSSFFIAFLQPREGFLSPKNCILSLQDGYQRQNVSVQIYALRRYWTRERIGTEGKRG